MLKKAPRDKGPDRKRSLWVDKIPSGSLNLCRAEEKEWRIWKLIARARRLFRFVDRWADPWVRRAARSLGA